jgi:hypothetical protein
MNFRVVPHGTANYSASPFAEGSRAVAAEQLDQPARVNKRCNSPS